MTEWTNIHINFNAGQTLTEHHVDVDLPNGKRRRYWIRYSPRSQWTCHDCGARRWAKNLRIHVYYDCSVITCEGEHKRKVRKR
jgi:hypothetical protein